MSEQATTTAVPGPIDAAVAAVRAAVAAGADPDAVRAAVDAAVAD